MTALSPTTQAILQDAYESTQGSTWRTNSYTSYAAAILRAVIEHVVLPKYQYADWEMADRICQELDAIADELEANQ